MSVAITIRIHALCKFSDENVIYNDQRVEIAIIADQRKENPSFAYFLLSGQLHF